MKAKYYVKKYWLTNFFVLIILSISNLSCDSSTEPLEPAVITYTVSGGYTGGIRTKLIIYQSGVTSLETEYPVLKQQLTQEEYNSLLQSFSGFNDIADSSLIECRDSFIYSIEYQIEKYSKTIHVDMCALNNSTNAEIEKLKIIIGKLNNIAEKVKSINAPYN